MPQFRLMVRSFEGWQMNVAGRDGLGWERRTVWSTWSQYETENQARQDAAGFQASLIGFAVIHESEYDLFCRYHRIG